jgi:antitoxin component YwqK of YwqJK toxin-antitoxin module
MNILRKIIPIFFISALIVAVVFGFLWLRTSKFHIIKPGQVIPENTVLYLQTDDFTQLGSTIRHHNNIWAGFLNYPLIQSISKHIDIIDSLSRKDIEFMNLIKGDLFISLNRFQEKYDLLFALSSPGNNATEQILKLVSNESLINKRKYMNVTIYKIVFPNQDLLKEISFYEFGGLLVFSPSGELLEASVRSMNSDHNIEDDPKLERLITTTGNDALANVFINFQETNNFLSKIIRGESVFSLDHFASWAALDLDIKPNMISLNGFSTSSDSLIQYLDIFKGQEPGSFEMLDIIPSGAINFKLLRFSNAAKFLGQADKLSFSEARRKKITELQSKFGININTDIATILSGELASLNIHLASKNESYFVIGTLGKSMAENRFIDWLQKMEEKSLADLSDYRKTVSIDRLNQIDIYRSPILSFPSLAFGDLANNEDYQYFSFIGNYLVFGNSSESLREFAYQNILGKTLINDDYFNELKNHFSSKSNLFLYANPSLMLESIQEVLIPDAKNTLNKNIGNWKHFDAFCFQSTSTEDLHYFHLFLNYSNQVREFVNTVWERKLDTLSVFKPAIVINHNTREKEILIQDLKNQLYLISNAGTILWKQKIDSPIMGEIIQIDYFKNGKLQYLFNTKNKIYVLDRNGNRVENFPIDLRSSATAGISLFDYDNNGTIRICVPGEDLDIYMYDKNGNLITGWNFKGADHEINQPIKHFRSGEKDYIVAHDMNRLYILDRKGKTRVKTSLQIQHSLNNPVYFQKNHFITSDVTGSVYEISLDGKVSRKFELALDPNHFFIPSDLDGNGKTEYIFTSKNTLLVYNEEGKLLFDEEYPENIQLAPVIYEFSKKDKKIGLVATFSGRIYLLNNDGSLYQGFPLQGTSMFSISSFPGLKARFNLIVGNSDNFLYNYSVK